MLGVISGSLYVGRMGGEFFKKRKLNLLFRIFILFVCAGFIGGSI